MRPPDERNGRPRQEAPASKMVTTTDIIVPLGTHEQRELEQLVTVVHNAITSFFDAGRALDRIRCGRLYRGSFQTFEAFVTAEFGYARQHAYRMIEAARVAEMVSPIGDIANEAQARELVGLEPDEAREAYLRAVLATDGKPTAKAIREAVGETVATPADDRRITAARARIDEINAAFLDLDVLILEALSNKVEPTVIIGALTMAARSMEKDFGQSIAAPIRRAVIDSRVDILIEDGAAISAKLAPEDPTGTFKPYTTAELRCIVDKIAGAAW